LAEPEVVLVIPCYNEEKRLPAEDYIDFVRSARRVRFVFVDDGSTDYTLKRLESLSGDFPQSIDVISTERNKGKAEAVRRGIN
jgi:dolichyl-phosphate beta-glucosyltransferase